MSSLLQLQRRMAEAVMRPLTRHDQMRRRVGNRSIAREAGQFIKPNDRLSSFERLEIYNRQYWFRVLDALAEDFPGLRAVVGPAAFDRIARAYLTRHPSRSFSLCVLGSRLPAFLQAHPQLWRRAGPLALEMAKLEWAHIQAFEAAEYPPLGVETEVNAATVLQLQPYLHLFHFQYPVDDLLLAVHQAEDDGGLSPRQRRQLLRQYGRAPMYLAVHRFELSVHYKRLDREAFCLLRRIQSGASLADAMQAAFTGSKLAPDTWPSRIESWFANWRELGWFWVRAGGPAAKEGKGN
jgi:hypothetical protein